MSVLDAPSRRLPPLRRHGTPPRTGLEANATIGEVRDHGPTTRTVAIVPDDGVPAFTAGQYFSIGILEDGRLVQRPYSAASTPDEPFLWFAVRLVPGGELTPRLWRLGTGDRVRLGPPKGLFRLADGDDRPHLLIGTGTGIAPLLAMATALARHGTPPRALLLHGVSRVDELLFRERAVALETRASFTYVPAISRPADPSNAGWTGAVGRLDVTLPAVLAEQHLDARGVVAYACGNPEALAGIRRCLEALGTPKDAIHWEEYWPAAPR